MIHCKEWEPEASARMVRPEQEEWFEVHETPVHTNNIEWQRWEEAAPVGHRKKHFVGNLTGACSSYTYSEIQCKTAALPSRRSVTVFSGLCSFNPAKLGRLCHQSQVSVLRSILPSIRVGDCLPGMDKAGAMAVDFPSTFYLKAPDFPHFLPGIFFDIHHAIPAIRVYSVPAAKATQIRRCERNRHQYRRDP